MIELQLLQHANGALLTGVLFLGCCLQGWHRKPSGGRRSYSPISVPKLCPFRQNCTFPNTTEKSQTNPSSPKKDSAYSVLPPAHPTQAHSFLTCFNVSVAFPIGLCCPAIQTVSCVYQPVTPALPIVFQIGRRILGQEGSSVFRLARLESQAARRPWRTA